MLDDQDNRAKPLLHLLNQLEKMKTPPIYLFLENVKNFEVRGHFAFVDQNRSLGILGYEVHETEALFSIVSSSRHRVLARGW